MKFAKYVLLTAIISMTLAGCGTMEKAALANQQVKVVSIINQMPAQNSQQQDQLAAELTALNPQATAVLVNMLQPPTNPTDNAARYGLSALTHYTSLRGTEAERKIYADALIEALPTVADKQNKAFIITQLQFVGKQEAVNPLAAYLNDDLLCDYAARALLTIRTDGVEPVFLKSLDSANSVTRPTLMKALGQLQSKAAAAKITPFAASSDAYTRETALYALANIADPASDPILKSACNTGNDFEQIKHQSQYLLFARRLAETGNKDLCQKICKSIISNTSYPENLRMAAENTLHSVLGQTQAPAGFTSLFNGKDLTGWKGLLASPYDNPIKRAELTPDKLAAEQKKADDLMRKHWKVVDGVLEFDGDGFSLATIKNYTDFEMLVDWKILHPKGDSGIYLRGTPQVQIWDPAQHKVGSGGLYNNKKNPSKPSMTADNPIGQWNTFRIKMIGEKVTVHLNGKLIVDNVTLENYWDRSQPIFPSEQIELQCHGDPIHFKNIFIREIGSPKTDKPINTLSAQEEADGFVQLFNGKDLTGWVGATDSYGVKDGILFCRKGTGRNIYTEKEYDNFVLRFEFKLQPGTNNGLGIRAPLEGDAAYVGMELQILDDTAPKYSNLKEWQYHGSIYGIKEAKSKKGPEPRGERSYLKPVGEWNYEEVIADGNHITVKLNGTTIVDADIKEATKNGTIDGKEHPGLFNKTGHIGFLGHGDYLELRNIRIRPLQ